MPTVSRRPSADPVAGVARCYIETLGKLGVDEAVPYLVDVARHAVGLRSIAVRALVRMRVAAPALAPMLACPGKELRDAIVQLLVQTQAPDALPMVRPLLKSEDAPTREAALPVVTRLADPAAGDNVRLLCFRDPSPPCVRARSPRCRSW